MATAQQIVTSAFRALQAIDINEQPSPNEAQVGLDLLNTMIAAWALKNLNVVDQTLTGTTALSAPDVTDIETALLAVGMNVAGTGIAAATRIKTIDHRSGAIVLTANATASGTVSLAFTVLPFEAKHEQGVIALLALQLAPVLGIDKIPGMVGRNADQGWSGIKGVFFRVPGAVFDLPRDERRVVDA